MKAFKKLEKLSLSLVGLYQAIGLSFYCGLVGLIFNHGEDWFGKIDNFLGPLLILSLLVVSVLVCGLLAFGYPVYLFWERKKRKSAISLVFYTSCWLFLLVFLYILALLVGR